MRLLKLKILIALLCTILCSCMSREFVQDEAAKEAATTVVEEITERMPEFLSEISDEVYLNDFELWDISGIEATRNYTGFKENVCELVYNGERCKAIYSDTGVVIVDVTDGFVVYYKGEMVQVLVNYESFHTRNHFNLSDLENDGVDELIIYSDRNMWGYTIRLEPLEIISVNYSEELIEEALDYGITEIKAMDTGGLTASFYISNTSGDKIEGNILLGMDVEAENIDVSISSINKYVNRKLMCGSSAVVIYETGDWEYDKFLNKITFDVGIKYDESRGAYYPESKEVRFNWTDSYGKTHTEGIQVDWN